jgi:hypothetical protein
MSEFGGRAEVARQDEEDRCCHQTDWILTTRVEARDGKAFDPHF